MREGAARELWEEVGIVPTADRQFFSLYANFAEFRSDHVALFVLRDFEQHDRPNIEIAESGFFAVNALPDETSDATRVRVREVLQGLSPSDYWAAT